MSIVLGDAVVGTVAIDGKDLRDGDIIMHPSGQFAPVEVSRVILRDEYGVTFQGCLISHHGSIVTRTRLARCQRIGNLIRLTVERVS